MDDCSTSPNTEKVLANIKSLDSRIKTLKTPQNCGVGGARNVSVRARVESGTFMRGCTVAPYAYIGRDCVLNNTDIASYCSIASAVQIGGMEHAYWDVSTSAWLGDKHIENKRTIIEADTWIAAQSVVKQGVILRMG